MAVGRERKQARKEAAKTDLKKTAARVPPRIESPGPIVEKSERVEKERQVQLFEPVRANELPPLNLLDDPPPHEPAYSVRGLGSAVAARRDEAQGISASRLKWLPFSPDRSSRALSFVRHRV